MLDSHSLWKLVHQHLYSQFVASLRVGWWHGRAWLCSVDSLYAEQVLSMK